MSEEQKQSIVEAIAPALQKAGYELVELKLARYGRGSRLQLYIDTLTVDGVTIDDCAKASRLVDEILESENFFENQYNLEVSSPGLDRPLKSERDYKRRIGRRIWVEFLDSTKGRLEGELTQIEESVLALTAEKGIIHNVRLAEIKEARESF